MDLNERQRWALDSIVDAFCPSGDGWPTPGELGVSDAILDAFSASPREHDRRELARLLNVWDSRALALTNGVHRQRFSELERIDREVVLLRWADSRVRARREVFTALRRATLAIYYALPGASEPTRPVEGGQPTRPVEGGQPTRPVEGGATRVRSSAWDQIGYDGPLGRNPNAASRALTITTLAPGTHRLSADVVIVGSGAGGGAAAAVLAEAGLDVIVLEAGDYYDDRDFDGSEAMAMTSLYGGVPAATADEGVALVAGRVLGGGTVVNWSTSLRTPREVRDEWASFGAAAFNETVFDESLDAVCTRLGVGTDFNRPSTRDAKLRAGCEALGWHSDSMPRAVRECAQGRECGYCGFGCRLGAKQSVVKTWLLDAHECGARLITGTTVERVKVSAGASSGVVATLRNGRSIEIDARATVLTAGAINTAAILKRSGLANEQIGRNLRLHPVSAVFGVFEDELKPWEGVMQALYSDQFRDLDGRGFGVRLETGPLHPSLLAVAAPFHGSREHADHMRALPFTMPVGVLLRDRDGGEVKVGRDGNPVVHYRLSKHDTRHVRAGIAAATGLLEAAGAHSIYVSQNRSPIYVPGAGSRSQFLGAVDSAGLGPGRLNLMSFDLMGTARMGGSVANSACDPTGQSWEARDLYVFDGSAFPTASGVNPQISIQAIAHMGARQLATRLAR